MSEATKQVCVIDPGFVGDGVISLGDSTELSDPAIPEQFVGKNALASGCATRPGRWSRVTP